ncbi:protein RETICULATA-RELATED 3, chloroplastic-like [Carex rostrata]
MAAAAFRLSLLRSASTPHLFNRNPSSNPNAFLSTSLSFRSTPSLTKPSLPVSISTSASSDLPSLASDGGDIPPPGSGGRFTGGGGGGKDEWSSNPSDDDSNSSNKRPFDPISAFFEGWRSRVLADPQFPFKVLMEELVGVTACVLGDMASRPNFGLNELDFVFSTLVVGSILNFVLMYLLAPTASSIPASLPGIFSSSPTSHMFEPGPYSIPARLGTFLYKGATFAAVGFVAGVAGTALSNGLIALRKKMDPAFETPNKAPPTLLNASTWALHMGLSSNFRYQTLNGIEYVLANALPPSVFKGSVVALRCANNVLGGMSFVVLARLTGSQKVVGEKVVDAEKESLIGTAAVPEFVEDLHKDESK